MHKKLFYLVGTSVAVSIAYFKGLSDGLNLSDSFEEVETETTVIDERERDSPSDADKIESVEEQSQVECEDSDCDETFETEHGMKIHYGITHKTDNED